MNRADYDAYLAAFNARDYQGVLAFYADDFEIVFGPITLNSRQGLLDFYAFLHARLDESITVDRFVCDADTVALEGRVRLQALTDITPQTFIDAGYAPLTPMTKGQIVEIPQLIHYHLRDGRITRAVCAVV